MKSIFANVVGLVVVFSCVVADFRQDSVTVHNNLRAKHHSPPLTQNSDLNAYAQNWAQNLASTSSFKHSNGKYGENLYMTSSTTVSDSKAVTDAINSWYSEVSQYDYNNPGFTMGTGHFTQVVWKNSKNLGIGVARSSQGTYVCGSYDPPGNYQGQFPQNVLRP